MTDVLNDERISIMCILKVPPPLISKHLIGSLCCDVIITHFIRAYMKFCNKI